MLDIVDFIIERGGDPSKICESQRRRLGTDTDDAKIDEIVSLSHRVRKRRWEKSQIGEMINEVQKGIRMKRKAGEDTADLVKEKVRLEESRKDLEEEAMQNEAALHARLRTVGNYVHDSVPVHQSEEHNQIIRAWTPATENDARPKPTTLLSHHEVLWRLGGYDPDRAVKIAGHRAYCLTGWGLFLNMALAQYGLEFLYKKGYTPNQPPQFMLKEYMARTAQLEQFDEELYKVSDGTEQEKYLIATSEQPLSALHAGEWLQAGDLPIKYAGYSTCYRKEAGSHGKDTWGVFRVHQFEKVEQFILTTPGKSWQAFEEMIATSEDFYKSLQLPYQVVAIVSGALNSAAAKKYDLEAYFPARGEFKELVSCTNCTDYQTRALDIRYGVKLQKGAAEMKKKYVHALNSTLIATERALCCVLENWQTGEGLVVPEPLRRFIPGQPDFLPYVRDLRGIGRGAIPVRNDMEAK